MLAARSSRVASVAFRGAGTRFFSSAAPDDVVVIGGGPGGYVAAIKAAQLGLKTTCIESRGTLGGTCLNVGCIPSKALLNSSHHYEEVSSNKLSKFGVNVKGVELDMDALLKQKNDAVTGLTQGIEYLFKKNNVRYVKGKGKFTSPTEVSVELSEGGTESISAKNFIIATGSDVAPLNGFEIDEVDIVSSTGALDIPKVPERMLVIGGGVIGLELGSVWRRLGSEVHVVEFMDAIAAGADGEVAKTFQRLLKKQGMKFLMKHKCVSGTKNAQGSIDVVVEPRDGGGQKTMQFDKVLVSVGRRPYTDGLGLDAAGVKLDDRGRVDTDEHLRTNVPHIYAIGDVIKGPMLAHKAEDEGLLVAEAIAGSPGHLNYDAIPSVVYTHPEAAWVGATEEQLKERGVEYNVGKFPMAANSRAKTVGSTDGFVKFLSDKTTDRILGVHIVHDQAGEMIAECALAVEYEASAEDVARATHAHPTLMEAVKESAMLASFGKTIHV